MTLTSPRDFLQAQDWRFPVPIAYGPGRISELPRHCFAAGMQNPLLVTDRGSSALPFVSGARALLEGSDLRVNLFSNVSPNPRDHEILEAREVFRRGDHDGVIAIGGGSGLDAGKALCLLARNELDLFAFDYNLEPPDLDGTPAFPPLICVPTTAGTGAETESTAMVTDTAQMMKLCVWHPDAKPALALLDPELTLTLPEHITAWTGIDALVHAIEAFCVPTFHPMCDGIALQAIALIAEHLPVAIKQPDNLAARGAMQIGACLAGIAFLKGLGLVHAISHMVGADYDTHHGLTNAVVLPAVLEFNAPSIGARIDPMAGAMGLTDRSFAGFYAAICELLDALAIPRQLSELGVAEAAARRLAEKAALDTAASTNPRAASIDDIEGVLLHATTRGR